MYYAENRSDFLSFSATVDPYHVKYIHMLGSEEEQLVGTLESTFGGDSGIIECEARAPLLPAIALHAEQRRDTTGGQFSGAGGRSCRLRSTVESSSEGVRLLLI